MPSTVKLELSAVDQLVKHYLLKSPTMFGSRLSVLRFLLFNCGNGYFWQKDGTLSSRETIQVCTEMNFADLDRAPAPKTALDERIARLLAPALEVEKARKKRERAIRTLIAEDIDLYATEDVMEDSMDPRSFRHMDLEAGLIAIAPYEVLDHAWARAMMEILNDARQVLRETLQITASDFSREKADPLLLDHYDKIEGLIGKVVNVHGLYQKDAIQSLEGDLRAARDRHL